MAKAEEAPAKEVKLPEEAKPTEEKKGPTMKEIQDAGKPAEPAPKKEGDDGEGDGEPSGDTVPTAAFVKEKKARKALEKRIKELEEAGGSGDMPSEDLDEIAEEFGVDKGFLKKLTKTLEGRAKTNAEKAAETALKPIQERERSAKIEEAFTTHFTAAMEQMPEFNGIVNRDVIKTLSLDPKNANKTFKQIIEDTYGSSLPGKKTTERPGPGGPKDTDEVDFTRAKKDPSYFKEVMANPELKKKYNDGLTDRIGAAL